MHKDINGLRLYQTALLTLQSKSKIINCDLLYKKVFQHSLWPAKPVSQLSKNTYGRPSLTYGILWKLHQLNNKLVAITCNSITMVCWPRQPHIRALFFKRLSIKHFYIQCSRNFRGCNKRCMLENVSQECAQMILHFSNSLPKLV